MSADDRRELMLAMLRHVVEVAVAADVGPVALATSEPSGPELARAMGIGCVSDGGLPWNDGLVHALAQIEPAPEAVLYLAGDLPLLRADEVRHLVAEAARDGVTIGRAYDGGTNALVVRPATGLRPTFGHATSSQVHEMAALRARLPIRMVDLPGISLDVDTPADHKRAALT
jgi:2-phospho-L-lactate guanylyltransferase